jgi:hypothetical protein
MLERVFFWTCGTRLFAWRKSPRVAGVALPAFDGRNAFAPTEHIWVAEKMDWVKIDDGLQQYCGTRLSSAWSRQDAGILPSWLRQTRRTSMLKREAAECDPGACVQLHTSRDDVA